MACICDKLLDKNFTGSYPKSWVVEVSNEGTDDSWEVIDRRENNYDLSGCKVTRNFAINRSGAAWDWSFHFIRLRQTGKNHSGGDCLCLCAFEVFGTLNEIPRRVPLPGEFPYYFTAPLNGIIAHLTSKYQGNVHTKGAVKVTAKTNGGQAKNAVELGTSSDYSSDDLPNQWICYDFKQRRVVLTNYSIRTVDVAYPKSWVLEASKDGSKDSWEVVDSRENNEDLRGSWLTRNFTISSHLHETFRFVRLRQTGKNHAGDDILAISSLELFGALVG